MLPWVLASALVVGAGPWIDNRPVDKKSLQHIGTGFVAGTAAMGLCTTYLVLRERTHDDPPIIPTWGCFVATVGAASAAYHYKEMIYDANVYGDGQLEAKGRRDMLEGIVPAALGAAIFLPVMEW